MDRLLTAEEVAELAMASPAEVVPPRLRPGRLHRRERGAWRSEGEVLVVWIDWLRPTLAQAAAVPG
jgi:hypothetical protein